MPSVSRRQFLAGALAATAAAQTSEKPNILWITTEDIGPQLGCYGDSYAKTPVLDALAARGVRYTNAWSNAPVCAPARTTIISGMYPPSTGSEHMRSMVRLPEGVRMYPCYLRDLGYYVTNNAKEDYNVEHTGKVWDESSNKAHWRNRKPGQPFFAIFNNLITHESQIRRRPHKLVHDPAQVRVPAYQPDAPEVRQDWAEYYDNITTMDGQSGQILKQLEDDGLADNTIVFFYGDHGAGMPRSKRWPYNSGLRVPLIVYVPEKLKHLAPQGYKPGGTIDRMVAFVDLAPTLVSLAGGKPPSFMQGRAFMGPQTAPAREYNFGFRGRMDERIDMVRSCTDGRYVYIRNFMPHRIYGQHIAYMFEMPTTQVWKRKYDAGELKPPQTYFWEKKPPEELYDLQSDRDEVENLASAPAHRERLLKMRRVLHDHMLATRDIGVLPECELVERGGSVKIDRILETAEMSSLGETAKLKPRLKDSDSAVRYWAAVGLRSDKSVTADLTAMLKDPAPAPRIAAAEALQTPEALDVLVEAADPVKNGAAVSILAMNAITAFGPKAKPALARIKALPKKDPKGPARLQEYPPRLIETLVEDLSRS